jgi:hypothetical protein
MGLFDIFKKNKTLETNEEEVPNYMDALFKNFILNELNLLSDKKNNSLNELNLYVVYKRPQEDWTLTISNVLNLSPTIGISIWHLWIKNQKIAQEKNQKYTAESFAEGFIENFYKDDSKVDVWEDNQLEEAKIIIQEFKNEL